MSYEKHIEDACKHFEELLRSQLAREERMEKEEGKTDFKNKDHITIGFCGGDGIGPVITAEGERVLNILLKEQIEEGRVTLKNIEGLTIENRMAKGKAIPEDVLAEIKTCDVLLKGPTTTPKGGTMESANVALRRELDLYANIRPVKVEAEGIDWAFFRENTEGEYVLGSKGIEIPGKLAMDFKVTTKSGTERIARAAFDYARANGKTKMAIVTKANIMKKTDGNFSKICHQVAEDYPEIEATDWYIDIMTAKLVNKSRRADFQVFLLPNLYGDIITDEAAEIQGGVGTAGSINAGDRYAMFEAIHGSAPRMLEEGRGQYANPASILKAAEMLVRYIGFDKQADKLAAAMEKASADPSLKITGKSDGATGKAYADAVISQL